MTNFLHNWFGHRNPVTPQPSHSYQWPGQSGTEYPFEIHGLDASLKPVPGIYIYAKQLPDGDWSPIYISQTRDLHQRLEGHVNRNDAIANGATHQPSREGYLSPGLLLPGRGEGENRQSLTSGNGMGTLTVDNLKVGTDFASVVPEPHSSLLLGVALLAGWRSKRNLRTA